MHENQSKKFMKRVHEKAIYIYKTQRKHIEIIIYIFFFAARQKLKINIIPYTFFTHWKGKKNVTPAHNTKLLEILNEGKKKKKEKEEKRRKKKKLCTSFLFLLFHTSFLLPSLPPPAETRLL